MLSQKVFEYISNTFLNTLKFNDFLSQRQVVMIKIWTQFNDRVWTRNEYCKLEYDAILNILCNKNNHLALKKFRNT